MLKDYLDEDIYNLIIKNFSFDDITEIRLRLNQKLIIAIKNKKYFLKNSNGELVKTSKELIENFIRKATENSIYAYNDNIINGYITLPYGIRVGIAGQVVYEREKIITIKNFQSINIRIPHFIKNCSLPIYDYLVDDNINNTLIISPPGAGKTTFIRDFIYQLNVHNLPKNILIADERNEICSSEKDGALLDLGDFCDIYTNCSKEFAFKNGIRSMSPDVIITDEIDLEKDHNSIVSAINCGVTVVATIHANDIVHLKNKKGFDEIIDRKLFSRYVVLSRNPTPGTIAYVYDEKFNLLYCRCV